MIQLLIFKHCVTKAKLTQLIADERTYINGKFDELMRNITNLVPRIEHMEWWPPLEQPRPRRPQVDDEVPAEEEDKDDLAAGGRDEGRLRRNHRGMRGNYNHGNNDPFAKTKFSMIPFAGNADHEAYLDRGLAVEQKLIFILFLPSIKLDLLLLSLVGYFILVEWSLNC